MTGSLVTDSSAPHGATLPDPSFSGSNFFPPDPNYWQHFMSNTLAVDQKLDRILNLFYEHKQKVNSDTLEMKEGIESLKGELQSVKKFLLIYLAVLVPAVHQDEHQSFPLTYQ